MWSYAKIGSPLSEEACALLDMVPNEVLRHLSDESRRVKVRHDPRLYHSRRMFGKVYLHAALKNSNRTSAWLSPSAPPLATLEAIAYMELQLLCSRPCVMNPVVGLLHGLMK